MTRRWSPDSPGSGSPRPLFVAVVLAVGIAGVASAVALFRGLAGGSTGRPNSLPVIATVEPQPRFSTAPGAFPVRPPPPDRPLLWFAISGEQIPAGLHERAVDWNGQEVGALALPCPAPCSVDASPDGKRLLTRPSGERSIPQPDGTHTLVAQSATIFDATGKVIATLASGTSPTVATWADDSRHLCILRSLAPNHAEPFSGSAELDLLDAAGGPVRVITTVVDTPFGFWGVSACSVTADRAVLSAGSQDGQHAIRVVRLSTGRLLYTRDDQPSGPTFAYPVASLTVSSDGTIAVEQLTQGGLRLRDLSTGVAAPWPAGSAAPHQVLGVSWHGRHAVTPTGVVDLTTGRTVWRAPTAPTGATARPASDDLLVLVDGAYGGAGRGYIIRADGLAIELPAGYVRS